MSELSEEQKSRLLRWGKTTAKEREPRPLEIWMVRNEDLAIPDPNTREHPCLVGVLANGGVLAYPGTGDPARHIPAMAVYPQDVIVLGDEPGLRETTYFSTVPIPLPGLPPSGFRRCIGRLPEKRLAELRQLRRPRLAVPDSGTKT